MKAEPTRITCLIDPLCGWCYGAAPVLEKLARLDAVQFRLAPIGLFAGENARPMDASFAAYAWHNDQRIARLTGQVFSDAYRRQILGSEDSLFDSAPATLGVVTVGMARTDRELEALNSLQRARYIDGCDTADLTIVSDILAKAGFTEAASRLQAPDAALLGAYSQRVEDARRDMHRVSVQGVPTLVIEDADGVRTLPSQALFGDFSRLVPQLRAA